MTRVDLLVPELVERDAIGTHSLILRDVLGDLGADVRFVTQVPTSLDETVTPVSRWKDPAEVVILQHGIGSLLADAVIKRRVPCVLNYHNITPLEFVEPWDPERIAGLRWGRSQIHELAPSARRAVCDSHYNATELLAAGYEDVRVSPVLWHAPSPADRSPDAEPVVLFVGRLTSNKCQEDLIAALALLLDTHPAARLVLVLPRLRNVGMHVNSMARRTAVHSDLIRILKLIFVLLFSNRRWPASFCVNASVANWSASMASEIIIAHLWVAAVSGRACGA